MTLTITDKLIRSTDTRHVARATHVEAGDAWRVTWLPGRVMDKEAAIAAMRIADEAGQMPADCDPEVYDAGFWSRVDSWAAMFGMSGPAAVSCASEAPEDAAERAAEADQAGDS